MEEPEDENYNAIFAELSQQLDSSSTPIQPALPTNSGTSLLLPNQAPQLPESSLPPAKKKRPFATVRNDKEVEEAKTACTPAKTQQDTKYCLGLWQAWTEYRESENGDSIGRS